MTRDQAKIRLYKAMDAVGDAVREQVERKTGDAHDGLIKALSAYSDVVNDVVKLIPEGT